MSEYHEKAAAIIVRAMELLEEEYSRADDEGHLNGAFTEFYVPAIATLAGALKCVSF